eukprot:gene17996-4379_t
MRHWALLCISAVLAAAAYTHFAPVEHHTPAPPAATSPPAATPTAGRAATGVGDATAATAAPGRPAAAPAARTPSRAAAPAVRPPQQQEGAPWPPWPAALPPDGAVAGAVRRAVGRNGDVIVAQVDAAFAASPMLRNWVCSLRAVGAHNFVVIATDAGAYRTLRAAGLAAWRGSAPARVADARRAENQKEKPVVAATALAVGAGVLYSDVDVARRRDPSVVAVCQHHHTTTTVWWCVQHHVRQRWGNMTDVAAPTAHTRW